MSGVLGGDMMSHRAIGPVICGASASSCEHSTTAVNRGRRVDSYQDSWARNAYPEVRDCPVESLEQSWILSSLFP